MLLFSDLSNLFFSISANAVLYCSRLKGQEVHVFDLVLQVQEKTCAPHRAIRNRNSVSKILLISSKQRICLFKRAIGIFFVESVLLQIAELIKLRFEDRRSYPPSQIPSSPTTSILLPISSPSLRIRSAFLTISPHPSTRSLKLSARLRRHTLSKKSEDRSPDSGGHPTLAGKAVESSHDGKRRLGDRLFKISSGRRNAPADRHRTRFCHSLSAMTPDLS